jgi:hypothetical protein
VSWPERDVQQSRAVGCPHGGLAVRLSRRLSGASDHDAARQATVLHRVRTRKQLDAVDQPGVDDRWTAERVKQRGQPCAVEEVAKVTRRRAAHEKIRHAGQRRRHSRQRFDCSQRILQRAGELAHLGAREALRVLGAASLDRYLGGGRGFSRARIRSRCWSRERRERADDQPARAGEAIRPPVAPSHGRQHTDKARWAPFGRHRIRDAARSRKVAAGPTWHRSDIPSRESAINRGRGPWHLSCFATVHATRDGKVALHDGTRG